MRFVTRFLPVHGAVARPRRLVLPLRRRRLPYLQVHGLDRARGAGARRSERPAERRLRPRKGVRLRVRRRPRADRDAAPRHPGHPPVLGKRPPLPEPILMRIPLNWLREYVAVDASAEELASRLGSTLRGGADPPPRSRGRERQPRPLPGRARARGRQAPERRPAAAVPGRRGGGRAAADRLRRLELRRRREGRGRAARRGAPRRPEARGREAPRGGLARDDPLRARAGARPGPRRDHGARGRPRARNAAGGRAAALRGRARGRDDPEPARPALGLRLRPRGRRDLRRRSVSLGLSPWTCPRDSPSDLARTDRSTSASRISTAARATSGACSRTSPSAPRRRG